MTDIASLRVAIETGDVRRATAELDKLERAAGRNTGSASLMSSAYGKLGGVLAGLSVAAIGREFIQLADTYSSMTGRLALATKGTADLGRTQRDLFSIAQSQRKELGDVVSLYVSGANAASELGASQQDLFKFTTAVSSALTINNTAAGAASGVLLQLGQAIGGATIQAQEFNSLIDGARPLLVVAAQNIDKAGGSVSKLKALVNDGKITSKEFFEAIVKGSASLEKAAASMPLTVGQATTQAGNSVLQLVGEIDKLTGTSAAIAGWASSASQQVDDLTESIRQSGGVFSGFFSLLSKQFAQARLTAATEEMQRMSGAVQEAQAVLRDNPGNPYAKDTLRQFNELAEAARQYAGEAKAAKSAMSDGSYEQLEARRFKGLQVAPDKAKTKKVADPYRDELKSLTERLALVGLNTEAEQIAAQVTLGKFGKISGPQREALLMLATEYDRRSANIRLLQEETGAREAASRLATAALSSSIAETDRLIEANNALRDEIELLGATEQAKAAVEVARVSSARALLEERAAMLANVEGNEAELQSLRQQIELLRQRGELLGQRGIKSQALDDAKSKAPKDIKDETYEDVRDALSRALQDSGNPAKAFAEGLGNAIFTRVTASLADAMATQLVGPAGSGGMGGILGSLISAGSSFLGAGTGAALIPGGVGAVPYATGTNYVPEDNHLALLHKGEAVVPARYNPAAGGGSSGGKSITYAPVTQINVDARTDAAQVHQIAANAAAQANRAQISELQRLGVL